jgi:2-hydroxymuconate-semialdehyde hydrolase
MALEAKTVQFEGIPARYWEAGAGAPLLMLHGSGPGASTHANWRLVIDELQARFHVIAVDLIGFGESGRKAAAPFFDFDLWVRQGNFFLDLFSTPANVLAHSLSGAIALKMAATNRKVRRLVTTGSIGAQLTANSQLETVWSFPETREDLIKAGKTLVFDQGLITEAYLVGREKILRAGDYETYYKAMFAGDKQKYLDAVLISTDDLEAISQDVLMLHGIDDLPVPIESTYQLARQIPRADVLALARCGHSVALEHPQKLVSYVSAFFLN